MGVYVGLMSGTSMDALDAALVTFDSDSDARLLAAEAFPLPPSLKTELEGMLVTGADQLSRMASLDTRVGEFSAESVLNLLLRAGVPPLQVRAIGSHGQTIRHYPAEPIRQSIQIGDPNIIAERTGITTVADFRRRDMAAGGEGAPLAPGFHNAVFRTEGRNRAILNLGGIANVTLLPGDPAMPVRGFDTGPANTLMDGWARRHLGRPMDRDGHWAATGSIVEPLLDRLLAEAYFDRAPPKSTGRELFNLPWLDSRLEGMPKDMAAADVQATLMALSVRTIAEALSRHARDIEEIVVCGGGAYNHALMGALTREVAPVDVKESGLLGIAPEWVEAMAFAWLAHRTIEGRAGNLHAVTGASHDVILGCIHPGRPA